MTKNNICNIATILAGVLLLAAGSGHEEYLDKAYQFPNLIAIILIVLAVALTIFDWSKSESDGSVQALPFKTLAVALGVFLALASLADVIGFYTISFIAFVVVSVYYSPSSNSIGKRVTSSVIVAGSFVFVLYLVFSVLLQVQAPAGFLF